MAVQRSARVVLGALLLGGVFLSSCAPGDSEESASQDPEVWDGDVAAMTRILRPHEGTDEDWMILYLTASEAWAQGLDTLPIGESMAAIGLSFVGTRYVPATLTASPSWRTSSPWPGSSGWPNPRSWIRTSKPGSSLRASSGRFGIGVAGCRGIQAVFITSRIGSGTMRGRDWSRR